jgi:hypothetical protein
MLGLINKHPLTDSRCLHPRTHRSDDPRTIAMGHYWPDIQKIRERARTLFHIGGIHAGGV